MNIIILGNSKSVVSFINGLKVNKNQKISIISYKKKCRPNNSIELKKMFKNKYNCIKIENINSIKVAKFIKSFKTDIIVSFWNKILNKKIIDLPRLGVIGSHPTPLPYNRGRHPLHWLLSLGIKNSAISFFSMDKKIDNGKIIKQYKYKIHNKMNIQQLESSINTIIKKNSQNIIDRFSSLNSKLKKQNLKNANYLRKRNFSDLCINLKMNFVSINNLVKSFTIPYDCAFILLENKIIRIKSVKKYKSKKLDTIEIGKILKITEEYILTRCNDSIIKLYFKNNEKINKNKIKYIYDPLFYLFNGKHTLLELKKLL
jgi:methionyl-tRNA formyltransferase